MKTKLLFLLNRKCIYRIICKTEQEIFYPQFFETTFIETLIAEEFSLNSNDITSIRKRLLQFYLELQQVRLASSLDCIRAHDVFKLHCNESRPIINVCVVCVKLYTSTELIIASNLMLVAYQGNMIQCGLYCKHFTGDLYFFKVSFRALSHLKLRRRVEFSISIEPSEKKYINLNLERKQ